MDNGFKNKIKSRRCHIFDDLINIKNCHPNKIGIDKKSYKNILVYYIWHVMFQDLRYIKINGVNPLYLIVIKINWYFEENNQNKYLTPVASYESKKIMKKYK